MCQCGEMDYGVGITEDILPIQLGTDVVNFSDGNLVSEDRRSSDNGMNVVAPLSKRRHKMSADKSRGTGDDYTQKAPPFSW
jgi:hypothetical protein